MTLHDHAIQFNTDKAWHDYPKFYQAYLPANPKRILEIGVHKGASLEMWKAFYPDAEVVGADFDHNRLYVNSDKGIVTHYCDQESRESLQKLSMKLGKFDIIIDDGGHTMRQQQYSLITLLPYCDYYVVEDLHTSLYPPEKNYGLRKGEQSTLSSLFMLAQGYMPAIAFPHLSKSEHKTILEYMDSMKIFYNSHDKDLSITAIIKSANAQ